MLSLSITYRVSLLILCQSNHVCFKELLATFFSIACAGLSWNCDEFNAHIKSAAFHKSPSIMEMKHLLGKPKYKASKFKFIV